MNEMLNNVKPSDDTMDTLKVAAVVAGGVAVGAAAWVASCALTTAVGEWALDLF